MAQLSVVLSGSCSQQCESRRGNADLSADKEVGDFLAPWRISEPYRSKVIAVDGSSCVRRSGPGPSTSVQSKKSKVFSRASLVARRGITAMSHFFPCMITSECSNWINYECFQP